MSVLILKHCLSKTNTIRELKVKCVISVQASLRWCKQTVLPTKSHYWLSQCCYAKLVRMQSEQ